MNYSRLLALLLFAFTNPISINGQTILIKNINVIHVESGSIDYDTDLWIEKGTIGKIGKNLVNIYADADTIIDGKGKYLIPGLFDMHAHFGPETWLKMYLSYGVTGVRVMAGSDRLLALRDSIEKEALPNPDLYISSPLIDGNPPLWADQHEGPVIQENTDISKLLKEISKKGYKELKIYNRVPAEKYLEILAFADTHNLKVSGHIPYGIANENFADPRHHSIEHMDGMVQFASKSSYNWLSIGEEEAQRKSLYHELNVGDYENISKRIISNGVWLCPTLSLYGNMGNEDIRTLISQNQYKEELAGIFGFWRSFERLKEEFSTKYNVHTLLLKRYFAGYSDRILAGTDSPNPFNPPGQSLHFELMHLSSAGFSNAEILKIATLNAARYLKLDHILGNIEEGKTADILLLDNNPLEDIRATQDIFMVLKNGLPVPR